MKKRISILTFVILSICVTNAQDIIRTITAGNWTKTLEKDVTYTLEPFGSNITIKEGETNLHSLVLPEVLTFSHAAFVPVTNITEVSTSAIAGTPLTLMGTVLPSNATNQTIVWSVKMAGTTGATISGNTFNALSEGSAIITATINNGIAVDTAYTKDFDIIVEESVVINGIIWATRNVGTHGQFVDNPEDFGGYYQWGRKGDGHEQPTSGTTTTLSTTDDPGHGNFILNENEPYDWRVPQNNALWNAGSESSPVKAANDPCPTGWRVPTFTELQSLIDVTKEWSNLNGVDGYFIGDGEPKLFLPAAGLRDLDGSLYDVGTLGCYLSSTPFSTYAYSLNFDNGFFDTGGVLRAAGSSVRCVAE